MARWFLALGLLAGPAWGATAEMPPGAVALREDVFIVELTSDVWRHVSFHTFETVGPIASNGLIVRADQGAVMIDTAWNPEQTAAILDWAELNVGSVQAVFVTHAHVDRLGGLAAIDARGIDSLGLEATVELAAKAGGPPLREKVPPGFRLDRYGVRGEVFFPGAGHTADNAAVYLEDSRVLAGSCMVRAVAATTLGNTRDADLGAWPVAIEGLRERYRAAAWVVPGHGEPGGVELLDHTLALFGPRRAQPSTQAGVEAEVAAVERAFAQTMADRDAAAFASFLSDEAVFLAGATARHGKAAVSAHWAAYFTEPEAPFSWAPETVSVLESGTLALSTGPVWNAAGERISTFTSIWRQEEPGVWRIVFDKGNKHCD